MNETPKNKTGWRILRRLLVALAILATLIAIFYAEEDWRGKHAWNAYQREAEARGEHFDLASAVPPPVPTDQNFFSAPIVANTLDWNRNHSTPPAEPRNANAVHRINFNLYRGDSKIWPEHGGDWQKGQLTDLKEWQGYFQAFAQSPAGKTNGFPVASQPQTPAADILLALSVFNPAIEELRQASLRPYARMPFDYESGFENVGELLPYLANVKQCGQLFQLRILAELDNGQSEPALEDIKLLLRVTDSIRDQPYLISHLVRIAMMAITLQPIYEGLAQQRWSDAQLLELEQALAKQDFLADFERAMQGEKVFAIQAIEKERITQKYKTEEVSSGTNKITTVSLRWMPSAFFYQNELAFAQMHRQYILTLVDQTNRIIAPAALRQALAAVQARKKHYSPYKAQALMVFPAIAGSVKKFAMIQSQVNLACVACALERFRLAHGDYPQSLDALAPQFIDKLPHDLINGQPLHYRRTEDGKFVLYSVGWNETDDGGKIVITKSDRVDWDQGDWVWQYPLK